MLTMKDITWKGKQWLQQKYSTLLFKIILLLCHDVIVHNDLKSSPKRANSNCRKHVSTLWGLRWMLKGRPAGPENVKKKRVLFSKRQSGTFHTSS